VIAWIVCFSDACCRGLPRAHGPYSTIYPGVPLRSTPEGFMLPPASQAKAHAIYEFGAALMQNCDL